MMSIEAVEKNIQAADLLYPYIDLVIPQDPITKDTVPLRTHSGNISVRPKNISYSNKEGMAKTFLHHAAAIQCFERLRGTILKIEFLGPSI